MVATKRAYLLADPASHSLSPAMHNAAFAALNLDGVYQARQVSRAALPQALASLREAHVLGANLSLPHKEAALPYLDSLSEAARSIGAVNTVINHNGQLHGDNTDAPGLLRALAEAGDGGQGAALVLGAGGAARSAVWALRSQGRAVYVLNRTQAKAEQLASEFGAQAVTASWCPEINMNLSLIVNASSAGLGDAAQTPLPQFDFGRAPLALVYDMVYAPPTTRLMTQARDAGLRSENGLSMLAYQAYLAFMAWTGADPGSEVFGRALGLALAART